MKQELTAPYLTPQQVSAYLDISLPAVYHITRLRKIKATKVGKRILYKPEDLNHYVKEGGYDFRPDERRKGDRRKYPHIDCFVEAHAQISMPPFKEWICHGFVLNLNMQGLLFESSERSKESGNLQTNDPVTIFLYFPDALRRSLSVKGNIAHIRKENRIIFGVQFVDLTSETAAFLSDYLS